MFLNSKLIKFISISSFILILLALVNHVPVADCLYEDQVGKFDWSTHYIGELIHGFYDDYQGQLFVSTKENVIASLNVDSGAIVWRLVLEKGDRGSVKFMHLTNENAVTTLRDSGENVFITVSGTNFVLVRGWNAKNGNLAWEWSLTPSYGSQSEFESHWFYEKSVLYQAIPAWNNGQVEVTAYNAKTGQQIDKSPKLINIQSREKDTCKFVKSHLVCTTNSQVAAINLRTGETKTLGAITKPLQVVDGVEPLVLIDNKIHNLKTGFNLPVDVDGDILFVTKNKNNELIVLQAVVDNSNLKVTVTNTANGETSSTETNYASHLGLPRVIDANCKPSKKSEHNCRITLSTENSAAVQLHGGKIKWIREESLADIVALEIIDLPLSDNEGAIEKQLKNKNGDIIGSFVQRISTQLNHVAHLLRTLFDVVSTHNIPVAGELTRDAFGLHTIIVVVTSTGKLFGIDNISGKHHYVTYLPNFVGFNNGQGIQLLVQRTSKHFPHPAQCTILAKNKETGNGALYQFNPITGKAINGGITELTYSIRQVSLLQPGNDFLKPILLLDKTNRLHVVPENAIESAHGTYIYVADKETGIVTGYYAERNGQNLEAIETWRINLSGLDNSQKIIEIAAKNPIEHVHSQGRVLNDRSVLYKYVNPNLVAIVTQGVDNVYKYILNVHLVDVVSGGIVSTITHRRVRGPVNIVHSENWLVYTYYNDKVRRTELTAIELYEGNTQANSTVWSSFDAPMLPAIEQQTYIIPSNVLSIRETITEKGITHKHILLGLSSGGIIEMPWHLLDPRRPMLGYNQPREEGTIPYMPELPLSSESIINYNQSISRIRTIYTAPSGLESTCLVVAYGLDFFVTRVAPSKTYDLLKEDFDYFLITTVLIGLTVASFVVKHMSAKKTLKQAWK